MKILLSFLFCILLQSINTQAQELKFNKDGKFKIVQFTDIHWKAGNPDSEIAATMMNEILDEEKPDLVIYTGDIVYASPAREGFAKAFEPAISRGIPFAVTLGNHDDEFDLNREEVFEFIKSFPNNISGRVEGAQQWNSASFSGIFPYSTARIF